MEQQVVTLFRHDANGRLLAVNEPGDHPAPRLFVGRTLEGNVWRFRHDLSESLVSELGDVLAGEPVATDLHDPYTTYHQLRATLTAHAPVSAVWQGPAWYVPEDVMIPHDIDVTRVSEPSVLREHFPSLIARLEEQQPYVAIVEAGQAVAVCCSARTSAAAAEAGVETAITHRGRGYASAIVATWASVVRNTGRLPLYSTSWENEASRGVAHKLGFVLYGSDLHIS